QHWLYTDPGHSRDARHFAWIEILNEFSTDVVDRREYVQYQSYLWQQQCNLFEVPFYYIEYGIAQLGALAMWRQYLDNREQTLDQYMEALSLGYTKTLKELFAVAGIRFDFSKKYIREIAHFVKGKLADMGAATNGIK